MTEIPSSAAVAMDDNANLASPLMVDQQQLQLEAPEQFQQQQQQMPHPAMSPSTLRLCLWTICVLGVLFNALVFRKYRSAKCRNSPSVRSSLQLLCVMAAADTVSLLALMLALSGRHLSTFRAAGWLGAICKLDLFLIHASSAFGIWCWFVLSAVRYLAIHHPYTHLRLHKEPLLTVLCVAICCCLLEVWILFDVTFIEEAQICGETLPEQLGKALQLVEILWTYFLPLTLITVLDLKVLCCPASWASVKTSFEERTSRLQDLFRSVTTESGLESSGESLPSPHPYGSNGGSTSSQTQPILWNKSGGGAASNTLQRNSKTKRRAQQLRILRWFLCISIIELGMNLPNYLVRLYLALISEERLEQVAQTQSFLWIQDLSQLLYFAQFAMNALYLVAINYVLPASQARRSSPQQLAVAVGAQQQQKHSHVGIFPAMAISASRNCNNTAPGTAGPIRS